MAKVRARVIEILIEQPNQDMHIDALSKQLVQEQVLGFGVEPVDVINTLCEEGKVLYEKETQSVKLLTDDEQLRFQLVLEKKACQRALVELTRQPDARMSVRMDAICRIIEKRIEEVDNKLNGT